MILSDKSFLERILTHAGNIFSQMVITVVMILGFKKLLSHNAIVVQLIFAAIIIIPVIVCALKSDNSLQGTLMWYKFLFTNPVSKRIFAYFIAMLFIGGCCMLVCLPLQLLHLNILCYPACLILNAFYFVPWSGKITNWIVGDNKAENITCAVVVLAIILLSYIAAIIYK